MKQTVVVSKNYVEVLRDFLKQEEYDKIFILTDSKTEKLCLPHLAENLALDFQQLTIEAGDENKNLEVVSEVWRYLSSHGATRRSCLVNLGGGVVTDLGGFAAATFKRGISCINIPTTLLAMVDAAVGGKTGINFNGLKNEVGSFYSASLVLLDVFFLKTLDKANLLSGYAEMLKHGLIDSEVHWRELLQTDLLGDFDQEKLSLLIERSIEVKREIVREDPLEKGLRKSLNLGHTVGHAFESLALQHKRPVLHGYAVAWGLICELYLSRVCCGFPKETMMAACYYIKESFGSFTFDCRDYEKLYELMLHDKKNTSPHINFSLLSDIGVVELNQTASKELIFETFDFYREAMGV